MRTSVARTVLAWLPLALLCRCSERNFLPLARTTFAQDFSCPPERIRVVARKGVPGTPPPPPPEVAADPGRLAIWQHEQRAVRERYDSMTFYAAAGCGHEALYRCFSPTYGDDSCSDELPLPGIVVWSAPKSAGDAGAP